MFTSIHYNNYYWCHRWPEAGPWNLPASQRSTTRHPSTTYWKLIEYRYHHPTDHYASHVHCFPGGWTPIDTVTCTSYTHCSLLCSALGIMRSSIKLMMMLLLVVRILIPGQPGQHGRGFCSLAINIIDVPWDAGADRVIEIKNRFINWLNVWPMDTDRKNFPHQLHFVTHWLYTI